MRTLTIAGSLLVVVAGILVLAARIPETGILGKHFGNQDAIAGPKANMAAAARGNNPDSRTTAEPQGDSTAASGGARCVADHARPELGHSEQWRVSVEQRIELGESSGGFSATTRLEADAHLFWVDVAQSGSVVVVEWRSPKVTMEPQGALDDAQRQLLLASLQAPFAMELRANGALEAVWISTDSHPVAAGLASAWAASVQVSRGAEHSARWSATEQDGLGTYVADYTANAAHLERRKLSRLGPIAHGEYGSASPVATVSAHFVAECGDAGSVEIRDHEESTLHFGERAMATSYWALRQRRTDIGHAQHAVSMWRAIRHSLQRQPVGTPTAGNAASEQRGHDEQLVAGRSLDELLAATGRAIVPEQAETRAGLVEALAAHLRLNPESAAEIAIQATNEDASIEQTSVLIGALQGAGTEQARTALVQVATAAHAPIDARENALAAIGRGPLAQGALAALELLAHDAEPELRTAAILAAGAAASSGTPEALALVKGALADATSEEELTAALLAAGNAADPANLNAIERALQHPSPGVRHAAAVALASIPGAEADALVFAAAKTDPSPFVRLGALSALRIRPSLWATDAIAHLAALDAEPMVRATALAELATRLAQWPALTEVLRRSADSDPDASVRQEAQRLLTAI